MQVIFDNTTDNWLKWGTLVRSWIFGAPRPHKVSDLLTQIAGALITGGKVPRLSGGDNVEFENYGGGKLRFFLPTPAQVTADEANLDAIAAKLPGQRLYPLPPFYPVAFGGALEVNLSQPVMREIGLRRLGEYVIQECQ